jgi:predicted DNA-binding transcriptional regulator AlpA
VNREFEPSAEKAAEPEMLTAKDLEALLKIDVKTIYSYVQRGLIPYVRIQSNVRFVKRDIFDWIGAHSYRPRRAKRGKLFAAPSDQHAN